MDEGIKVRCSQNEPLKVMISGAPASGKGTRCELIVQKYGLVHISTGDLLRSEVAAGSEIGNQAKEYMNSGRLVPDEVVTTFTDGNWRLSREDAKEKGWPLDGFPRSFAQAQSLEKMKIRPYVFIALDVKSRLQIYKQNVEAIVSTYSDLLEKIDGNCSKDVIFGEISSLLSEVQKEKETRKSGKFAVVEINIPELNPEQDVYQIGTLMELVRVLALSFADDGKRVKVSAQGSMGEEALAGMPLQLAGTRQILEYMD
ncbi:adenylate kinase [Artemisia annua]|uniref:adenylate kinase n=1 Tax=Artemisia annua TaxID=35608 RepID=A0A2U1MMX3_ARTAN|nr:adenylate kinase [Artemisia annua]